MSTQAPKTGQEPSQPSNPLSSPPLNVIALISGGKDSLFSILHCLASNHRVVALANLHPPSTSNGSSTPTNQEEDLNSYMYQTVGHTIIPLYASALEIPLFRQEILGSAVNTARDYSAPESSDDGDETESLVPLLMKVKEVIPEANAISTGAILSTYQRTRVESVALRLGLTPLSYLWQYPVLPPYSQSVLLKDMAAVGQDARIIKVASGGLDGGFIWENVAGGKTISRLQRAMARFGDNGDGAVLGEGGEFETLAIDGPGVLWKKRIEVEGDGVVVGEGGSVVFKGKNSKVVEKESCAEGLEGLRIPEMWDEEFKKVFDGMPSDELSSSKSPPSNDTDTRVLTSFSKLPRNTVQITPSTLSISNLASPSPNSPPTNQLTDILTDLSTQLTSHNLTAASISHTTLLLRRISDFTLLNPLYSTLFTTPNPPSRVTISGGALLPPGIDVMLSAITTLPSPTQGGKERSGLHVQSRSYWAPANIGPYSQAITTALPLSTTPPNDEDPPNSTPEIVYIAGQIPLHPASMTVFDTEGFRGQTVLSLQHLWRIGRTTGVKWWTAGVAYVSDCEHSEAQHRVSVAKTAWRDIHTHYLPSNSTSLSSSEDHDEDDDNDDNDDDEGGNAIDPWDLRNRTFSSFNEADDVTFRAPLPDPSVIKRSPDPTVPSAAVATTAPVQPPPCYVAQISQLPRNVDIEWHSTGLAKCSLLALSSTSPDGDGGDTTTTTTTTTTIGVEGTDTKFFSLEIDDAKAHDLKDRIRDILGEKGRVEHAVLYVAAEVEGKEVDWDDGDGADYELEALGGVQWVPCRRVWGDGGREIRGVLVGRGSSC